MEHIITFPKLGLEFTVNDTAFTVGSLSVKWYGILIGIGLILAVIYAIKSSVKMNIDEDKLLDAAIVGVLGGVVGARVFYILFYPGDFFVGDTLMDNIVIAVNIHSGGLAIFGGIIGGLLCGGLFAKRKKMNIPALFDVASLGFLIGQGIGRWGNFVNQEAFGVPTDLPWGMASEMTGGIPVHPCFLYESLWCFLGFIILHIFTRKFRRYDGQTFLLYIIWYGFIRFFIEQLRTDSLMITSTLRVSVVVSAICVVAGMIMLIALRNNTNLSGCGSKEIMEVRDIKLGVVKKEKELARDKEELESKQSIIMEEPEIVEKADDGELSSEKNDAEEKDKKDKSKKNKE